jgi:hypothetical protein
MGANCSVNCDRRIPSFDMTQRVLAGLLDLQLSASSSHRLIIYDGTLLTA